MPTYLLLSQLASTSGETQHAPPDRIAEVDKEIANFGCKVVSQCALLGQYDSATIVQALDNETVAHLSVDPSSRGTVKIRTLPAIELNSLIEQMKRPPNSVVDRISRFARCAADGCLQP